MQHPSFPMNTNTAAAAAAADALPAPEPEAARFTSVLPCMRDLHLFATLEQSMALRNPIPGQVVLSGHKRGADAVADSAGDAKRSRKQGVEPPLLVLPPAQSMLLLRRGIKYNLFVNTKLRNDKLAIGKCTHCNRVGWTAAGAGPRTCHGGCEHQSRLRRTLPNWKQLDASQCADVYDGATARMSVDLDLESVLATEPTRGKHLLEQPFAGARSAVFRAGLVMRPRAPAQVAADAEQSKLLLHNGFAVVPLETTDQYLPGVSSWMTNELCRWAPELSNAQRSSEEKVCPGWRPDLPLTLGGGALSLPSSFHATPVRELRQVLHARMRAFMTTHFETQGVSRAGATIEQIPGQYTLRMTHRRAEAQEPHSGESASTGTLLRCEVNLDSVGRQVFWLAPGSHLEGSPCEFVPVDVPVGHMLIVHPGVVRMAKATRSKRALHRLSGHFLLRTDSATLPLHNQNDFVLHGATPVLADGSRPAMHVASHVQDYRGRLFHPSPGESVYGVHGWSQAFHYTARNADTGVVHRYMPSLRAMDMYVPRYTQEECLMFHPMQL